MLTAIRSTRIIPGMFILKMLWGIVAHLLTMIILLPLPMFVFAAIAVRVVAEDLVPGAVLAALFAWIVLLSKLSESESQTVAAVKSAHRRFVCPFGER